MHTLRQGDRFRWSLACGLLAFACATAPQDARDAEARTVSDEHAGAWQARIDEVCAPWTRPGSPGCAVGVIRDGELVFARGYGLANLEHELPITPRTVFDIGSTSKQFTAACIGLLEQDGLLSADDDVRKWVPELPDYGARITLRHLLHHTSGLRDYLELFLFAGRKSEDWTTGAQALAMLARQRALNFQPGEEHLYSNSGYFLLSIVVERVSGKSLALFAKERIFEPLGMHDSHFHDDHTLVVARRATGYAPRAGDRFGIDMSDFEQTGDGGVMTTIEDLARWDGNFESHRVGGEALQSFLHARGRLNDGTELTYAAGLAVDTFRGLARVSHGGSWAGYRAQLMRFPEQRFSVLCLANLGSIDPSDVCVRIATLALGGRMADERREPKAPVAPAQPGATAGLASALPHVSAEELSVYAGLYESPELEARAEVAVRDGKLFVGEVGNSDFEIPSIAHDRFGAYGATFEFVRDGSGAITGFKAGSGRMRDLAFNRLRR